MTLCIRLVSMHEKRTDLRPGLRESLYGNAFSQKIRRFSHVRSDVCRAERLNVRLSDLQTLPDATFLLKRLGTYMNTTH